MNKNPKTENNNNNSIEKKNFHPLLRKFNNILAIILIVIVLIHGTVGSFILFQIGYIDLNWLAWLLFGLTILHAIFGLIFTREDLSIGDQTKKWYHRETSSFWTIRISGLAIIILLLFHFSLFGGMVGGQYVPFDFNVGRLLIQILLILSLFVHIFANIRPLLSSMGIVNNEKKRIDLIYIFSIFLLLFTIATVFYFLFWQFGG